MNASQALEWMEQLRDRKPNTLFRGQRRVWSSIRPTICRLEEPIRGTMWRLCVRFHAAAQGVTGYSIPLPRDRIALFQHYIGKSPLIDLTGTPAVALYFALTGETKDERVVYALDRDEASDAGAVISDHGFLALPLDAGGMRHRWLRQDGYTVGPASLCDADAAQRFDMLELPGLEWRTFEKSFGDDALVHHFGNLEDTAEDPLAIAVRGAVASMARALELLTPEVETVLRESKTNDPYAMLASALDSLEVEARQKHAPARIMKEIQNMRSNISRWDTGWECSLDAIQAQVLKLP